MSRGKKIIVVCLAVVIVGAVVLMGLELYNYFLKPGQRDPFIQAMIDEELPHYRYLHMAFEEDGPWRPEDPNWPRYLTDVNGGLAALRSGFLYPIPLNPNYAIRNVDFAAWKAKNSEVIGYLEFETLPVVSYPVLYRAGSDFYLKHDISGASDIYGEIYVEGMIRDGHSHTNTIIYGHNMRNGTMFGSLRKYKDAAYFPGNEFFWYYTPNGKYRYQIFSVHETLYTSDTFTWFAAPGPEYTAYLQKMKSQTKYETGVTPADTDEIITLCTCTSAGGDYRLVLQGRLVYKDEITPTAAPETPAPATAVPAAIAPVPEASPEPIPAPSPGPSAGR